MKLKPSRSVPYARSPFVVGLDHLGASVVVGENLLGGFEWVDSSGHHVVHFLVAVADDFANLDFERRQIYGIAWSNEIASC